MVNVVIVDCCLGNLRSVQKALEKLGAAVSISNRREDFVEAEAIVLPGVGAFRDASKNLEPLKSIICKEIEGGKPLLGICLGLQLLFTESIEGGMFKGLNVFQGRVVRFPEGLKVPQMGWNTLKIVNAANPLVEGISDGQYVYFIHSYFAEVDDETSIVALTTYGVSFPSIVSKGNVFATQFHPEKSGEVGMSILNNFLNYAKR